MKIYDCFIYFDEDLLLDVRLNILNKFVDKFVIVESIFSHRGEKRKPTFDIKKFKKFQNKIEYILLDKNPTNLYEITNADSRLSEKLILNGNLREFYQRNSILLGLKDAGENDLILISDVDEIPNLKNFDKNKMNKKIILFQQDMFYYKFNLKLPNLFWSGTKACKKKNLKSPQWLRNIKNKKYPFYRIDTIFSQTKYIDIMLERNGGWHFSNMKTASEIEYKLKSYLHHREFDENPMSVKEIDEIMRNKQAIYDLTVDKKVNKIGEGSKLEKFPIDKLPKFLQDNLNDYKEWID
mgnify:CR=1 FL=1